MLSMPRLPALTLDTHLYADDAAHIRAMAHASGVFTAEEISVAGSLAEETLRNPDDGYQFIFLRDAAGVAVAYSCYGEIPMTDKRYDLYWIIVHPMYQKHGLAQQLLHASEASMRTQGGVALYAETSGTPPYAAARAFYIRQGFNAAACFKDYYRAGDDKWVFTKQL